MFSSVWISLRSFQLTATPQCLLWLRSLLCRRTWNVIETCKHCLCLTSQFCCSTFFFFFFTPSCTVNRVCFAQQPIKTIDSSINSPATFTPHFNVVVCNYSLGKYTYTWASLSLTQYALHQAAFSCFCYLNIKVHRDAAVLLWLFFKRS